jgi:hypothetical protein
MKDMGMAGVQFEVIFPLLLYFLTLISY